MSVFTNVVDIENVPLPIEGGNPTPVVISGTVTANVGTGTQPVSGTVTVVQPTGTNLHVTVDGTVATTSGGGATATITRVATSASSVLLLAANASRKKAVIMTETGSQNYVAYAATASVTAYTYLLGSTTNLEVTNYTGAISLIRATGTGNVQVTEIV